MRSGGTEEIQASGRHDRIAGGILALIGLATGLEATTFDVAFLTDPVGPKALPVLVAVILFGAGAEMSARPRAQVELPPTAAARRMALAGLAFLAYGLLLPWLGFFLSTSLVVAVLGLLFGGPRRGSALAGVGLAATLWLLFVVLLSLPLPIGDLWIR